MSKSKYKKYKNKPYYTQYNSNLTNNDNDNVVYTHGLGIDFYRNKFNRLNKACYERYGRSLDDLTEDEREEFEDYYYGINED